MFFLNLAIAVITIAGRAVASIDVIGAIIATGSAVPTTVRGFVVFVEFGLGTTGERVAARPRAVSAAAVDEAPLYGIP